MTLKAPVSPFLPQCWVLCPSTLLSTSWSSAQWQHLHPAETPWETGAGTVLWSELWPSTRTFHERAIEKPHWLGLRRSGCRGSYFLCAVTETSVAGSLNFYGPFLKQESAFLGFYPECAPTTVFPDSLGAMRNPFSRFSVPTYFPSCFKQ